MIIAVVIFVLGYLVIALEHKLKVSKSAVALTIGALLWIWASFIKPEHLAEALTHTASETFGIVVFLLAAMSLVEVLVHYEFFDIVRGKLFQLGLKNKQQFLLITLITFFFSAILDNLTTTIVMIQIARRFFRKQDLMVTAASIVIAANAGGAFSPIGDVTTIMLWLAHKFSAVEILTKGFLPSFVLYITTTLLLLPKISNVNNDDVKNEIVTSLGRSEVMVILTTLTSFSLPLIMNTVFHLPPYLGLLIGLGLVWLVVDIFKQIRPKITHLNASIEHMIKKTDIASLKFFIGILLAVSALNQIGVLEQLSTMLFGPNPALNRLIFGNIVIGLVSAILDNVPLAALSLQIIKTEMVSIWILLALTLGTGGSLLIIGSAAGVVAMGMIKKLNFSNYFKIAFFPVLIGYFCGVGVWLIQHFIFKF